MPQGGGEPTYEQIEIVTFVPEYKNFENKFNTSSNFILKKPIQFLLKIVAKIW
jgi:hypothetical protein